MYGLAYVARLIEKFCEFFSISLDKPHEVPRAPDVSLEALTGLDKKQSFRKPSENKEV
jgi:hypothetical protein